MKKTILVILSIIIFTPFVVLAQTESTVSKTVVPYRGVADVADVKAIKKTTESNSLNVLLQAGLYNLGYNPGEIDGVVGPKTINAVKGMQSDFGLNGDGVFGPMTAQALQRFADTFPNQSVSEVKINFPQDFKNFRDSLKTITRTTNSTTNQANTSVAKIPNTPKGVLTYVLSKNQPDQSVRNSSLVSSLVSTVTSKPRLNTSTRNSLYELINTRNTNTSSSDPLQISTNYSNSTAKANSRYTCVTTSEHTEYCSAVPIEGSNQNTTSKESYYCRGANCEVFGLNNEPKTETAQRNLPPTDFARGIDFSKQSAWGEPVVFDKKTGKATIYLRDHGYDPNNGQRNLSVIFVDLAEPIYNR